MIEFPESDSESVVTRSSSEGISGGATSSIERYRPSVDAVGQMARPTRINNNKIVLTVMVKRQGERCVVVCIATSLLNSTANGRFLRHLRNLNEDVLNLV